MSNLPKKILGFFVGAGLCVYVLGSLFEHFHLMPRGAGWIFVVVSAGAFGAKLAGSPMGLINEINVAKQPISDRWWGLSIGLRLSVFIAFLWVVGALYWIDRYDWSFENVLAPALMVVGSYFGYSIFVKGRSSVEAVSSAVHEANFGDSTPPPDCGGGEAGLSGAQTSRDREREMNELINRMK